jgi:hypothetical protein
MAKISKTVQKLIDILEKERNYGKLRKATGLESKRIKAIRTGKEKPTRSEIAKIAKYTPSEGRRIIPEKLHEYVYFTAAQIKDKMYPKYARKIKSKAYITSLYPKKRKYVTATKKNGQKVYYYVILLKYINKEKTEAGHGFMDNNVVERLLDEKGDNYVEIIRDENGNPYIERETIFNVLSYVDLYNLVDDYVNDKVYHRDE